MSECFICKAESSFYCKWNDFDYLQCNECGLVYLSEMPSEEEIYDAYEGGKSKAMRRRLTAPFRNLEQLTGYRERVADFDMKLKKARPYLDPYPYQKTQPGGG